MPVLMVWGCTSGAGKSLLTTALCRWAANQGLAVAPFKAQNMSNNARVVPGLDGGFGEIGSAQYFQALAARAAPEVDMNPVLLKPERDTASQVVLQGRVAPELSRVPWRERSAQLAIPARESFERLASRYQLIVVEGAGSPAEINLAAQDYVNLSVARWAQARGRMGALLVSDIDRGGSFAHLFGTWALLPDDLRPALKGFVLNKFRGDPSLLAPGPQDLERMTGVPLLGVLPLWAQHGLPEEDGLMSLPPARSGAALRVAIVAAPHMSNLDEFQPLQQLPQVQLVWAREPQALEGADWIVLPGSKQVSGDLAWLHAQGLAARVRAHAQAGRPVLGICGGLQMLGRTLEDPDGVDGQPHGPLPGLDLLPLHTRYAFPKRVREAQACFAPALPAPWQSLQGLRVPGYEIRCGVTQADPGAIAIAHSDDDHPIGWQHGSVLGLYTHGLFEAPEVLQALWGVQPPSLDAQLNTLAANLEAALTPAHLRALTQC
jgi:adenosylcobyric acid synthase